MEEMGSQIVVGVDAAKPSRAALQWALREAHGRDAELVAAYAWHVPSFVDSASGSGSAREFADRAQRRLEAAVGGLGDGQETKITLLAVEGHTRNVLSQLATGPQVEMLVLGTAVMGPRSGSCSGR